MSTRVNNGAAVNGVTKNVNGASGAATGVVLTYTVPAGMQAELLFAEVNSFTLAPTVAVQYVNANGTYTLGSGTTAFASTLNVQLQAGETIQVNVTALVAASSFNAFFGIKEYLAA